MEWIVTTISILSILLVVSIIKAYKLHIQLNKKTDIYLQEKSIQFEQQHKERMEKLELEYQSQNKIYQTNLDTLQQRQELQEKHNQDLFARACQIVDIEISKYKAEEKSKVDLSIEQYKANQQLYEIENKREMESRLQKIKQIFEESISKMKNEEETVKAELEDFRKRRESINQEILRQRAIDEQQDFYRICLTEADIEDMKILSDIAPRMRRKDIIPKLIWETIVARPTNEMIKRVVKDRVGGIYKCVYIPTGEVYIGRTTNFKTRIQNHNKVAIGLDSAAPSTFHAHMTKHGLWNYTWEILEECSKEEQNEREKYYIDFYESNKYGLNMRMG